MAKKSTKDSKLKAKKTAGKKVAKKVAKKKAPKKIMKPAKRMPAKKKPVKAKPPKAKLAKKVVAKRPPAPRAAPRKPKAKPVVTGPAVPPPAYVPAPNETAVGKVTHYYSTLQVAVVQVDRGSLQVGDTIHIKGHTTDFRQSVESMEVEHERIERANPGDIVGLKVIVHAREHDVIYKIQPQG